MLFVHASLEPDPRVVCGTCAGMRIVLDLPRTVKPWEGRLAPCPDCPRCWNCGAAPAETLDSDRQPACLPCAVVGLDIRIAPLPSEFVIPAPLEPARPAAPAVLRITRQKDGPDSPSRHAHLLRSRAVA